MDFIKIIILLYACTGIISSLAYLPTVRDQLHGKRSATTSSYSIWVLTGFVSFLYAFVVIQDFLLTAVNALSFILCVIILILALRLDTKHLSKKS